MKYLCPLGALLLAACATPPKPPRLPSRPAIPAPPGTPSSTVKVLAAAPDNKVMGAFCQPDFLEGKYSVRGDTLAFAGVTADGRRSAAIPDASWRGGSKARPCRTAAISS